MGGRDPCESRRRNSRRRARPCLRRCSRRRSPDRRFVFVEDQSACQRDLKILLVSQMYPGSEDPDFGVFVAQLEAALAERGHEIERAAIDRRRGGKRRYAALGTRHEASGPSVPPRCRLRALPRARRSHRGALVTRAARRHRARPGRCQRGVERGDSPGDPVGLPAGSGRRRRVRLSPRRARALRPRGARQDGGRRLRGRHRAVLRGAGSGRPAVLPLRRHADGAQERRAARGSLRAAGRRERDA